MHADFSGETDTPPRVVLRESRGQALSLVWRNEAGGTTYQVGHGHGREFIKWAPAGSGLDLLGEAARLVWAAERTPAPRVLGHGAEAQGTWLRTAGLPGESAVSARWLAAPGTAVAAIGRGLRALHEALPVRECPFSWSIQERLAAAPGAGRITAVQARAMLARAPAVDRLVVCHGDACSPNTLLGDDGRWTGHVDFDALGVADRWADLAVALWANRRNYGPGWDRCFLEAYGVDADQERIAYYQRLWEVT